MKRLLYFEEYENNLSHSLFKREDIDVIIIRTSKNMKFFSDSYLKYTSKFKCYTIDFNNDIDEEIKNFKNWLKKNNIEKIDCFLSDSEYYLAFANRFARKLGLEVLNDEQIKWVRDKVYMKEKFRDIGIDTVDFQAINSKEELKNFFLENGSKRIVFKPRRGMNSIKTYIIDSIKDIDDLDVIIEPGKYMAENFCYDYEWSIESLVQNGIVLDSYVTYIPNPTLWATINNELNCHMTVPKIPNFFKFIPKEFIQQIVTGMQLENGAMTIEVFISEDGYVKASELGWRLPGCQATLNHSYSYGIDIYNILIDIALRTPVTLKYRNRILSVGDLYLPNKEGLVEKITPLDELLNMDGVIAGEMFAKAGEYQKKRRVGNDASGWVQVVGIDEKETLKKMKMVFNNFEIETRKETRDLKHVREKK